MSVKWGYTRDLISEPLTRSPVNSPGLVHFTTVLVNTPEL